MVSPYHEEYRAESIKAPPEFKFDPVPKSTIIMLDKVKRGGMNGMCTVKQAAERRELHLNTVKRQVKNRLIPVVKYEKVVRIE